MGVLIKINGGTPNFSTQARRCNYCNVPVAYWGLSEIRPFYSRFSKFYARYVCPNCGREVLEYVHPGQMDVECPTIRLNPTDEYYKRFGLDREVI